MSGFLLMVGIIMLFFPRMLFAAMLTWLVLLGLVAAAFVQW